MFPEGRALEFLLAAVVALVVVGPKDLPVLLRKLGQALGKLRALASEFRASFDEMARQSELDELRKEVEAMRRAQYADVAGRAGEADLHETLSDIEGSFAEVRSDLTGVSVPPITVSQIEPAEPEAPAKPKRVRKTAPKVEAVTPPQLPEPRASKPRPRKPPAEPKS